MFLFFLSLFFVSLILCVSFGTRQRAFYVTSRRCLRSPFFMAKIFLLCFLVLCMQINVNFNLKFILRQLGKLGTEKNNNPDLEEAFFLKIVPPNSCDLLR